jgi:hypothetical protein
MVLSALVAAVLSPVFSGGDFAGADFSGADFTGVDGKPIIPFRDPSKKATVLIYVLDGCPIARKFTPEINRIYREFSPRSVGMYLVFAEPDIKPDTVKAMTRDFGLLPRAFIDRTLARQSKIKAVPTTVLYDSKGVVRYQGRIDDRFPALGIQREPRRRDLHIAITELMAGKRITVQRTETIGCLLP